MVEHVGRSAPELVRLQRRIIGVLVTSQALGGIGVASGFAVGSLLGAQLYGSEALAGLTQTASVLGSAVLAVPVSRLIAARGRRSGLAGGYVVGAVGAVGAVLAALAGSFWLLIAAMCLFGAGTTANLQARYAATDLAEPHRRGRALSTVVWATTVGAVLGPNLAEPGGSMGGRLRVPVLAGPFLFSIAAFGLAALVLVVLLRPDPLLVARAARGPAQPAPVHQPVLASLRTIRTSPGALLGLAAIAVSHAVMVGVMTMTPLHMADGGAGLRLVGLVISAHVAGMYAFSPLVGALSDRIGRRAVIALGAVIFLVAMLTAGPTHPGASPLLGLGLFLLGLGWSCGLVAGSTQLTESVPVETRPGVQGAADLVMGVCGALGGLVSGLVVQYLGYAVLALLGAALAIPLLVVAIVARPPRVTVEA